MSLFTNPHEVTRLFHRIYVSYFDRMLSLLTHDHEINRIFHHMYVRCVDFMVMFLTHDHVCARFRSNGESIYTWS